MTEDTPTAAVHYLPAPAGSEDDMALGFAEAYADRLRYIAERNRWLEWDGKQWAEDSTLYVYDLVRNHIRKSTLNEKSAKQSCRGQVVAAVEKLARSDRRLAAVIDQWDQDPWILNTPSGTVDLRTGELGDHRRDDYATKCTAVGPGFDCPTWLAFIDRITNRRPELGAFLQKFCGYALTGVTVEHIMGFLYGTGGNGKTVFLKTICGVMGAYAVVAQMDLFMASPNEQHPTGLAGLQGARLVVAIETEEGRRWAEARVKALTGGDRIRARFMRQDFFEFTPSFKLLVAGNHLPGLRGVDEAIRRRMNLIPFEVRIPEAERDKHLETRLQEEWPGILQWMIDGCLLWQRNGIQAPEAVAAATGHYLEAEDAFTTWFEEKCDKVASWETEVKALYSSWKNWTELSGEFAGSRKRFSQILEERGYQPIRIGNARTRGFKGVQLKSETNTY